MTQLILELPHLPALGRDDFLVADSNAEAAALIDGYPNWSQPVKALVGPKASGKSHLAAVWGLKAQAQTHAACRLEESMLTALMDAPALLIDDLDAITSAQETILFHLYNHAVHTGKGLLLCARTPLSKLPVALPDLVSRLSAVETAELKPPCDSLMNAVLVKLFHDRQIRVGERVISYIVPRMERSFEGLNKLVDGIDHASLVGKKAVTIPLISSVLKDLEASENHINAGQG
ncbi:MAG: HdaA/DnaA family protein [Parvibaculales bacterium]